MSERMTNILGYLTLAAILGAIWILFGEDPTRDQGARGERTFAGLADRINETATVRIEQDGTVVTLTRAADGWGVAEKAGYPADEEKVRSFLRGLALSERREPKTANSERFARLGLGDEATRITLQDDTQGTLLTFEMGTRKENASGRSLTYVFQASDTRSWLVGGLEAAPVDAAEWLDIDLVDIADARISSVTINDATLKRDETVQGFVLDGLAEGETAAASYKRSEPARTLAQLTLEDVEKTANPLLEPVSRVVAQTSDGLELSVTLFQRGDDVWAQFAAAATEVAVEAEAASLNERTAGWLFKLSSYDANILTQGRADFIEPPAAEAP